MKSLQLALILGACGASVTQHAPASAAPVQASLSCDVAPAKQPWDHKTVPVPQSEHSTVQIYPDPADPLGLWAVFTDDDVITASLGLRRKDVASFIAMVQTTNDQNGTEAMILLDLATQGKVRPPNPPRIDEFVAYFQTSAQLVLGIEAAARAKADQCLAPPLKP
jgi:hypothetical protein